MMQIVGKRAGESARPLEEMRLTGTGRRGVVTVADGRGRVYFQGAARAELTFTVGGALGWHTITWEDAERQAAETLGFRVDAQTLIADAGGQYADLLRMLHYTMISEFGETNSLRWQGRLYRFFIGWLRDHVHVMKGMKYFAGHLKEAIDLYRDSQREDGMIWDNVYPRTQEANNWDTRFAEGGFIRPFEDRTAEFKRIPVENDVEYLFVEGLYHTWKAVGDDGWMADSLDAALRAYEYSVTSPYRWSEKYQLLKRGYTIDTWDFQDEFDSTVAGDAMRVHPDKTHFGVMFGDNTGYIAGCRYLAEMLEHVGRADEAASFRRRGQEMQERLDRVSWNGRFFTHHVREDQDWHPDLGVNEADQVSLSNAYSLNRGLTHEQCTSILRTYQQLRKNLPSGSPGEWYTIYPPFMKGFGGHCDPWQYMNGGVTPIVAGELAHGAFEHGFETYGVNILQRLKALGERYGSCLHSAYTGALTTPPHRTWMPLDISALANTDFSGTAGGDGVMPWTGEGDNDLHEMPTGPQHLASIDFLIPDPQTNGRRGCLGLSGMDRYARQIHVPLGRTAASLYLLHTASRTGPGGVCGTLTLHYTDGTDWTQYVVRGQNVSSWWLPAATPGVTEVAWRGRNAHCGSVGVVAWGLDNPHPDKVIDRFTLAAAADGAFWAVLGVTVSDQPVYFAPSPISYGIPNGWSAAAVVYALIEGLAGVVDSGTAFSTVTLAPRWLAASVADADVTVRYPASDGYAAYHFTHDEGEKRLVIHVTGSGAWCVCHLLLPPGILDAQSVHVGGEAVAFRIQQIEQSYYVDFRFPLRRVEAVTVQY